MNNFFNNKHTMAGKRSYGAFRSSGKAFTAKRVAKRYKTAPRKRTVRRTSRMNVRTGGWLGIEKKFLDTGVNNTTIVASSSCTGCEDDPVTMNCLNAPTLGDGQSNREGRQIAMESITIKGTISVAAETLPAGVPRTLPQISIFLVLDTQTNGAQLNSEDVFEVPFGSNINGSRPFRDLQYEQRFRVLAATTLTFPQLSTAFNGLTVDQTGTAIPFTLYKNLKGLKTNFTLTGTDGTIATIADNSLHVICCASHDSECKLYYNSRLRFYG